ncbi:MAG: efflux RND transporter periplasmic adaptor subunit [Gallionella sp.]|nr:efflux RND transporter periplasmic adaptor subunit [Gallionella sp.]
MKYLKISTLSAAVLAVFLLSACGEKSAAKDDHGTKAATEKDVHGHADSGEKITHFGDKSELFVEFPTLVAGQPATFVAHFTWLADFKPVAKGRLTVVLAGGTAPEERFVIDAPSVPGIYKPAVTPKTTGKRELTLIVESDQGVLRHELGPVDVFADAKAALAGHDEHEDEDIGFTKEQQWKIDFATVEAVKGIVRESVAATGTVKAQPDGEALLAAPMAGLVRTAGSFPRVGQAVKKGQVLAYFVPRLGGETDHAMLEAAASKARIALEQARRERERMEMLFKEEAIPEKRLLEAKFNERVAVVELDATQQRLGQYGDSGGGIALRAPIGGVIADVPVAAGAFVTEGAPLIHIANMGKLWLEARVPESDIGRLGVPSGAWFAVDGFSSSFNIDTGKITNDLAVVVGQPSQMASSSINGKLVAVGGVVDAATRTVPVIFEFANPGRTLPLGMTAKVQLIAGGSREGILVPAGAVQDESGTNVVYVQTGGESFERRLVQVGTRDGERVEIRAGLEAGQRVVAKGAYLIRLSSSKSGPSGHAH